MLFFSHNVQDYNDIYALDLTSGNSSLIAGNIVYRIGG